MQTAEEGQGSAEFGSGVRIKMPDFIERPTDKFVRDAHDYLTDIWKGAHADWKTLDSFLHRTFAVWPRLTDAEKILRPDYRPSKPANIVKHAIDNMMAFSPKVHRNPIGSSENREEDADAAEVGLSAILNDSAAKSTSHPWRMAAGYLVHYSYAVIEGPLPRFPKEYEHDPNHNPIEIRAPNPATVLMDPMDKQPPFAIRRGKMPAIKIHELSQKKKGQRRKDAVLFDMAPYKDSPFTMVEFQEYWTDRWHAFRVSGDTDLKSATQSQILYVEVNPLGFLPYTHAFAGLGLEPSTLDDIDPKFLARGILWDTLDSIRLQAQSRNAKHQLLMDHVFAPLLTEGDAEELKQQLARGADILGVDNVDGTRPMATQPVARWVFEIDRDYSEDIEEGTVNRVLSGQREQGVVTVGQQALLETRSRARFVLPLHQLEYMASITGSRIFSLVDNMKQLGGTIGAHGKNIRKAWLHGNYNVDVKFEPSDPVLDLQRRQQGLSEVQMGVKDYETYWEEDAGVTNVSERWQRLANQQVRTSPEMWALFLQEAAEGQGVGPEFEAAQNAIQGAAEPPVMEGNGTGVGNIMDSVMTPPPEGVDQAVRQLRQPLSPTTTKPAPIRGPVPGGT